MLGLDRAFACTSAATRGTLMVYVPCVCHACAMRASCTHHACTAHATTHVQERFNSMHPAYYHLAHACILCFDVTRKQTYKNLPDWHSELVGDGAYPRGRHRPSSPPGVTEGAGRTYAHTAERGLGGSVAPGSVAPGSVAPGGPGPTQPVS